MADSREPLSIEVRLGARSYSIVVGSDLLAGFAEYAEKWLRRISPEDPRRTLIVTDSHVAQPHATTVRDSLREAGWQSEILELPPGEQSKSQQVASQIYDRLVDLGADRHTPLIAVGGGVVGDVAGFAAATYARGIPFLQVPSSLLAQVDSSVGGKVAVNHPRAKNLIGAFYQPQGVLIDTATLTTLTDRHYRSGLAEVVKYGVILDREFFDYLEAHRDGLNARTPEVMRQVIRRSCRLKAGVVEQDEEERTGLRAVLNYGHTFAHAFEALADYEGLLHGEAVAVGMICASRLAERLHLIEPTVTQRQIALLDDLGLPTSLPDPDRFAIDALLDRMKLDKKTVGGRLRFILPTQIGRVQTVSDVPRDEVRAVLEETMGQL